MKEKAKYSFASVAAAVLPLLWERKGPAVRREGEGTLSKQQSIFCTEYPHLPMLRMGPSLSQRRGKVVASVTALLITAFLFLFPAHANANCSSPTGTAGNIVYNLTYSTPEYCNGMNWIPMGPYPGALKELAFNNVTGQPTGSTITSNTVTLVGIFGSTATCNAGCKNIIRNGVSCGTSCSGFIPGDTIAITQSSSGSYGVTTSATVTLGTLVSDAWTVKTATANAFSFNAVVGQPLSTTIQYTTASGSAAPTITWSGSVTTLPVSCTNSCTISINGGAFVSSPTTMTSGQTIDIKLTSSASYLTQVSTTVTIGGTSAIWNVTTGQSCTDTVATGYDQFTPTANQTISYSLYGGGGGGGAGTSGSHTSGTVAVTTSQTVTVVVGGGGGGGYYASGGSGYYGGGCGGNYTVAAGGGGGGSTALIVGGALQSCANGGAGGGSGGGGATCVSGGANFSNTYCTSSGLGIGASWNAGNSQGGNGTAGGGGATGAAGGGGGGYGAGGGSGADGSFVCTFLFFVCLSGYYNEGGAGGSSGGNGANQQYSGGIGSTTGGGGAAGTLNGGNGGSASIGYVAATCNW